jgi:predicted nucleotidyltransferase
MIDKDLLIAEELKKRLSNVIELIDFRVFGSRARGDADEYSDLDVFLEVETLDKERKDMISDIVWEVGFKYYLVISPIVFTRDEIENSPLRSSSIIKSVTEEGIRI